MKTGVANPVCLSYCEPLSCWSIVGAWAVSLMLAQPDVPGVRVKVYLFLQLFSCSSSFFICSSPMRDHLCFISHVARRGKGLRKREASYGVRKWKDRGSKKREGEAEIERARNTGGIVPLQETQTVSSFLVFNPQLPCVCVWVFFQNVIILQADQKEGYNDTKISVW